MRITWSDVAEADLDQLYDYIARDAPYYAEQYVDRLIAAVSALKDHPRLGRSVLETKDREDVRELIFQNYRIIYLLEAEQVHILTVIHASRNLDKQTMKPWDVG